MTNWEQLLSVLIKRRKDPTYRRPPPPEDKVTKKEDKKEETKAEKKDASKQGKEAKDAQKPQQEWVQTQDPYGRLCWQHAATGQVTYGGSYNSYNPALAQQGFSEAPMPVSAVGAAVAPPGYGYGMSPVPWSNSPVPYVSPVPYGASPVAMYPIAPWNMGAMPPQSPVPQQVPDYVKRQYAEAKKAQLKMLQKKQEEEQKKVEARPGGVWETLYDLHGNKYWQHSVSGRKLKTDPYW